VAKAAAEPEIRTVRTLRGLKWLLMRLVLREQGSPAYAVTEGELDQAVRQVVGNYLQRRFPTVDDDDLDELCFRLLLRWRAGRLTGFAPCFLEKRLITLWQKKRPGRLEGENAVPARGGGPAEEARGREEMARAREKAERFRDGLPEDERFVLDRWVEDGKTGWKERAAEMRGRSGSWVSRRIEAIRHRFQEIKVKDEEAFVELLRPIPAEAPDEVAGVEEEASDEGDIEVGASAGCAEILRARLFESQAEGTPIRAHMDRMARGDFIQGGWRTDEAGLRQAYPCEPEWLDEMQRRYMRLAMESRAEQPTEAEPLAGGEAEE
jgi:hypothetical protein